MAKIQLLILGLFILLSSNNLSCNEVCSNIVSPLLKSKQPNTITIRELSEIAYKLSGIVIISKDDLDDELFILESDTLFHENEDNCVVNDIELKKILKRYNLVMEFSDNGVLRTINVYKNISSTTESFESSMNNHNSSVTDSTANNLAPISSKILQIDPVEVEAVEVEAVEVEAVEV
ncbi:MAG: hypothetical protein KQH59_12110, partial [Desulfobulbaceae bacterium]|nr:hypothetical protein [Desulfobulbaceae bacterium]